ncbi:MAG TPA: Rieske 2Fe-2S domain-containing protein [Cellvibrio sp.]|nr:Rieske 2Fe-2S domain-containing protein [Cellvibrio sp.]
MLATDLRTTDIPENGSKGFECNGEKYFAVKKDNSIYIYKNSCPHIGVALEWVEDQFLDSSQSMIQCANHGALFVIESGACVAGPCSGQKLMAVKFSIQNDLIFLS